MSKFAGWISDQPHFENQTLLSRMLPDDDMSVFVGSNYGLATAARKVQTFNDSVLLAIDPNHISGQLHSAWDRYLQKGDDFMRVLDPPFALLLIDAQTGTLILASDPIGLSNIYYAQVGDGLVFGSRADFVVRHPGVSEEISAQSVYDYVYFHHCPSPNTIYKQVKKLEGGQSLLYRRGKVELKRYWQPTFHERLDGSVDDASRELKQLLLEAVGNMVGTEDGTGAFLSGGLDSSSVAGALAHAFPGKAKTFSMGFPVEGYNEIEYANLAVTHFHTRQHEYYVTPEDTVAAVPLIAAYYDEPFGNSSALAAYYCAKLAKDNGVRRLLAGDGGDEIFAGNERYAKQMLFEHYHRLPGFAAAALEAGLNHLPSALADFKLLFKAKRYVEQANAPMPDRLQDYNFLHRHPAKDIFNAEFLDRIDLEGPLQLLRSCYSRPENASTLNRMLYMDWKSTLHDNDLVKVNRMCEMLGVEVCYPLLDQRIVDLSCRIPSNIKLKGQKLRWFYKQAMADFLPAEIINKPKHGFGLPFGVWLKDHKPLKELAYDALHGLKNRGYFQPTFLDHAIDMHQSVHAAYYGELVWVLMMLELWFAGKSR